MLVGRDPERARLAAFLDSVRAGDGAALVVHGEPGVGKTALLEDLRSEADGMLVLDARGAEGEAVLPYAGLSELVAPVLELVDRLPGRRREALAGALALGEPQPGDRFGTYAATLSLLAEAAAEAPLLAVVDDAHWLDAESGEALRFSARRLRHERAGVVFAARAGECSTFEAAGIEGLHLSGLDAAASCELLRRHAERVDDDVALAIHCATGGNPLALIELAQLLEASELAGAAPLPDPLPAGPNVEQAFGARVAALPEATQRALLTAAADAGGELAPVARALRLQGLETTALEPAEEARLVSLSEGRVEFAHPLLRSAVYGRAPARLRRQVHAALAEALVASPSRRARRAWHLAASALDVSEPIALELEWVATQALARAAPIAAARASEAAARLTPASGDSVRRLLAAARAYHLAGTPEPALRVLERAVAATEDPLVLADARRLQAQVQTSCGAPGRSRALLTGEAIRVEPHDRARAAAMRLEAALVSVEMGELHEALRLAEQAWPVASAQGDAGLRLFASIVLAATRILRGDAVGAEPLLVPARALTRSGELSVFGPPAGLLSYVEMWLGEHERAHELIATEVARLRADGALSALPYALATQAWAKFMLGDWRAAEAAATESLTTADELGQRPVASQPLVFLALIAGAQGRADEARGHIDRVRRIVDELGVGSMRTMIGWAEGRMALAAGAYDEAVIALDAAGRHSLEHGLEEPSVAAWAQDLAEAYARLGRIAEAEATLATLERQATRTGGRLAHAGAARCRGLLADDAHAEQHFRRAMEWHDCVTAPFERARTQLCFGERLRRARHRRDARDWLTSALRTFDALEAKPWSDRARRELAATGERARQRILTTADRLTPQELQVALLVAEGATNREAAAALFVTPKTIEFHLGHIYGKLGVRNRSALAKLAATRGLD